jgi:hypothetical protein
MRGQEPLNERGLKLRPTSVTDGTLKRKDGPLVRAIVHPLMPLAARLLRLNIRGLQALRALRDVETHLLILRERLEAF